MREEYPDGVVLFHDDIRFGRYLWSTIKLFALAISVALVLMMFVVVLASSVAAPMVPVILWIGLIVLGVAAQWLLMRFGLVLPAVALGKDLSFRRSWALTRPLARQLVVTAALVSVIFELPNMIGSYFSRAGYDLAEAASGTAHVLIGLPFTWIGIFAIGGVLNVLYGHLCENRPI